VPKTQLLLKFHSLTKIDLFTIAIVLGVYQSIILAVAFALTKHGKIKANRILATFMLLLSYGLFVILLYDSRYYLDFPVLIMTETPLIFLFGPLLLFYTESLISKEFELAKRNLLHLIPFFLFVILLMPFYFQDAETKIQACELNDNDPPLYHGYVIFATGHILFYISLIFFRVKKYSRNLKGLFSNLDKINLWWVVRFSLILVIYFLAILLSYLLETNTFYGPLMIAMIGLLVYAGLKALTQMDIHTTEESKYNKKQKAKYETSALTAEMAKGYLSKLDEQIHSNKVYLNPNITLPELASLIAMSTHHLSQILNEYHKMNFFEFINHYRVENAKTQLIKPGKKHIKISEIAYISGFTTLSSFNAAFRKSEKMTPSHYRRTFSRLK
jgi:AraC-like DNA-binding protein